MSSTRKSIVDIIEAWRALEADLRTAPVHALDRQELLQVLEHLESIERSSALFERRLLGQLATQEAWFARRGTTLVDVLVRRLRVSPAEARRRIDAATRVAS
jgi:hypothetical protein